MGNYRGGFGTAVDDFDDEWVNVGNGGAMTSRRRRSQYDSSSSKTKVAPQNGIKRARSKKYMRNKSMKVKAVDIGDHLGKMAKTKVRGLKLWRAAARLTTGTFSRVEESVRAKYEANSTRIAQHQEKQQKAALERQKDSKAFKEGEAKKASKQLAAAAKAKTSPDAIDELVAIISATKESFSMTVTTETMETLKLAENRLYAMRAELVARLRKRLAIARKAKVSEFKKVVPPLDEAITTLASADVPNQEELITDSLQLMSEIEEISELRDHLLKMDRTSITILV